MKARSNTFIVTLFFILMIVVTVPVVSAEWYNPLTWFGDEYTIERSSIDATKESVKVKNDKEETVLETYLVTDGLHYKNGKPHVERGVGYTEVLTIRLKPNATLDDVLNGFDIINMKNGKKINKEFDIKLRYLENINVSEYTEQCETLKNGTYQCSNVYTGYHIGQEYAYMDYAFLNNTLNVMKGQEVYISIFMRLEQGEYLDIIPKIAGIDFDFWASVRGDLGTGLLYYYAMNTTTAVDSTGNLTLTMEGSITTEVIGLNDKAFEFDGSSGYLNDTPVSVISNDYTLNMWVKNTGGDTALAWFGGQGTSGSNGMTLDYGNNCGPGDFGQVHLGGSGAANCVTIGTFPNSWIMVTATYDGTNMRLYYNGSNVANDTAVLNPLVGSLPLIGARSLTAGSVGAYFDGTMDEVGIWNRALSTDDIALLLTEIGYGGSVDNPPTVTLISPANGTAYNTNSMSVPFTCKGADDLNLANLTRYLWNMTGGALIDATTLTPANDTNTQFSYTVLGGNNYTWSCVAVDNTSQSTFASPNWSVLVYAIPDDAPNIEIGTGNPTGIYTTSPQTFDFNYSNVYDVINLVNVSLNVNSAVNLTNVSGANATNYIFSQTFTDGTYIYYGSAFDNSSQESTTANQNFTIDSTPPSVTISSPPNGSVITQFNQSFYFNYTANDTNIDTCWIVEEYVEIDSFETNFNGWELFLGSASISSEWASLGSKSIKAVGGGVFGGDPVHINKTFDSDGTLFLDINIFDLGQGGVIISKNGIAPLWGGSGTVVYNNATLGIDSNVRINILENDTIYITAGTEYIAYYDNIRFAKNTTLNCGANTTTLNYPTSNPDSVTITLYANDTLGNLNSSEVTLLKNVNVPEVFIQSPVTAYGKLNTGDNVDLNFTILNNITTLSACWYNYNSINTTLSCFADDNFTYVGGQNTLILYSNDTLGNLGSNSTTWTVALTENSQTFPATTTEGSTETFLANVTLGTGVIVQSVGFNYNGTQYIGEVFASGSNYIARIQNFIIPNVDVVSNVTFYFNLSLSTGGNAILTAHNTTVTPISIDDCSVYNNTILEFHNVDEKLQTNLTNSTMEYAVNVFSNDGSINLLNVSASSEANPLTICLGFNLTNTSNYLLDTIVKYTADAHQIEYYNIDSLALNNDTAVQNITLYDLLTTNATEFKVTYTGANFVPVEDALIFVNRQYIDENTFKTVELPKTDSNGQTLVNLVRNTQIYNFIVVVDGVVTGSFNNIIAFCDDFTIGDCRIQLNGEATGEPIYNQSEELGISYTQPTYNNNTRFVSFNFVTTDGSVKNVVMNVTRNDVFGNNSVCTSSVSSSGGTLTCAVPIAVKDTDVKTIIYVNGLQTVTDTVTLIETGFGIFGFFVMFIYVLAMALMFARDKTLMLVGVAIAVLSGIVIGFIEGRIIGGGAIGISLLVGTILMIYRLNKEKPA